MPKTPMRIMDGSSRPYEPFWRIRGAAESESGEPEIELYGPISEYSWWGDEVTPEKFKEDLYKAGNKGPVTVRINSGGGDVIAASVIRSTLVDYPGRVTVRIDGLAASAATFVAMAGDIVRMQDTAFFMIHDPSIIAWGNEEDLKGAIDLLRTVKAGIIDAYMTRTELSVEKLSRMMAAETWMTAKEAQGYGFIDEVIGGPAKPAAVPQNVAILNHYLNPPAVLLEPQEQAPEAPVSPVDEVIDIATPEEQRLRDEIHMLL